MRNTLYELYTLARDLRGSSSSQADELWGAIDPNLWATTRNPWMILQTLTPKRREELAHDRHFREILRRHTSLRKQSLKEKSWFQNDSLKRIAYLSMEFGLSESLPIYSGGLGILAGDHLKAASDLGVPLTGVGLLYGQGYFRQVLSKGGTQTELYPYNDSEQLPITPLLDEEGGMVRIPLPWPGRTLWVKVWRVEVGRIFLYLLDTNDLLNIPADRAITAELYAGGADVRLQQEMVLGIGGWRLMEKLWPTPDICHLNEGHAALAIIERAQSYAKEHSLSFDNALSHTKAGNLFTTHTAVPAGFDRFDADLLSHYLSAYLAEIGLPLETLLRLGQATPDEPLNMAYLAVRGSGAVNGVSKLHGKVTQELFADLKEEVPIGSITNGVHIPSWESPEADDLWTSACGAMRWMGSLETLEEDLKEISNQELWDFRNRGRENLTHYARTRLNAELRSSGLPTPDTLLDPDVLTIGFARRFATYKRIDLLLTDEKRLTQILTHSEKPIQLIMAGKAHPDDEEGKAVIARWLAFIRQPHIRSHATFLADYDILLAERLVQGIDVWLNMPRRPWEASGTSGMKVLANGGLNLSELDGWWDEAYSPEVGWALGDGSQGDAAEAEHLYTLLEGEIRDTFYTRNEEGIPEGWLRKVRESMATLTPRFSTNRMVREYTETYYLPQAAALHQKELSR